MYTFIVAGMIFAAGWSTAVALGDVAEAEEVIVAARRRVEQIELEMHAIGESHGAGAYEHREVYYIDGTRMRRDTKVQCTTTPDDGQAMSNKRDDSVDNCWKTICIGCRARTDEAVHIEFTSAKNTSGDIDPIVIRPMTDAFGAKYEFADPRWIGLFIEAVWDLGHRESLNEFVRKGLMQATEQFTPPTVTEEVLDGIDVMRIEFRRGPSDKYIEWLGRGKHEGCVPQLLFVSGEEGRPKYEYILKTEHAYHINPGIWFPSRARLERKRDGIVMQSEVATIRVRSINEPIDRRVFSVAGMDFVKAGDGAVFIDSKRQEEMEWDGVEFGPRSTVPLSENVPRTEEHAGTAKTRLFLGVNLLVAAAAVLLIALHRYRTTTPR